MPGQPTRSLYHFELLIALCRKVGFHLAQEFFWYNPAKLPSPAEWVNVRKIRVKDAVECVWWLSKTPNPKASNQKVLQDYSPDMRRLLERGYRAKVRPSGHIITKKFKDNGGSIPANIIICGNNDANGHYLERCKETGHKPHPARFPVQLPLFFIRFLTDTGDLVIDPFAGSNTTGEACEVESRRWIAVERNSEYLETSRFRFEPENMVVPLPPEKRLRADRLNCSDAPHRGENPREGTLVSVLVEVDPLDGGRSIRVRERHRTLEDVSVLLVVGTGRVGPGDFEEIAKLVQEHRVIGSFRPARGFPAPEEVVKRRGDDRRIGHELSFRRWGLPVRNLA